MTTEIGHILAWGPRKIGRLLSTVGRTLTKLTTEVVPQAISYWLGH